MSPRASSASTTCDPMNPAAPVTMTFSGTRLHPLGGKAGEIIDGLLQPFANADLRLPPEHRTRACDVGLANLRIVLGEPPLDQRGRCLRQLAHHLRQLAHGVLVRVPEVRRIVVTLQEAAVDAF